MVGRACGSLRPAAFATLAAIPPPDFGAAPSVRRATAPVHDRPPSVDLLTTIALLPFAWLLKASAICHATPSGVKLTQGSELRS